LREGQVLVAGGQDSNSTYLASAELYEPATNRWSAVEPLSSARGFHTATALPDGRVLVAGGKNDALYHATAEAYDPKDRRWRPAGRLNGVRKGHAAVLLPMGRGAVLVVGGVGEDAATALATAELYDVASNDWAATGPLAQPREGLTATLATKDGNVLACGGYYSTRRDTGIGFVLPSEAERYDPGAKRWGMAGTMAQGRVAHTATVLPDGRVLIAGGQAGDGSYLATAELYNPATNYWAPAGQMSRARGGHTDALLRDGQVLVIGGQDSNEPLNSVERFDPKTNTWTTGH
jgi:N-acetylneuraminic acid mutarotase